MVRELILKNSFNNRLVLSSLTEYNQVHQQPFFFSVKYVEEGVETYQIDGKVFDVHSKEYLLTGCATTPYEIYVRSAVPVKGMCLFLPASFVLDVYTNMIKNEDFLLDYPGESLSPLQIQEKIHGTTASSTVLIKNIYEQACSGSLLECDSSSLFYSLCEKLLFNVQEVTKQKKHASFMKKSTTKELTHRLILVKTKLDHEPDKPWSMTELSKSVNLSEFHFFRCFKRIFNITPHQYLLERRMLLATSLLSKRKHSITEVALLTGFSDVHAFSKAFKKRNGFAPSDYENRSTQNLHFLNA